jgi:hypothetical protein
VRHRLKKQAFFFLNKNWGLNSGPHACSTRTLITGATPPDLQKTILSDGHLFTQLNRKWFLSRKPSLGNKKPFPYWYYFFPYCPVIHLNRPKQRLTGIVTSVNNDSSLGAPT